MESRKDQIARLLEEGINNVEALIIALKKAEVSSGSKSIEKKNLLKIWAGRFEDEVFKVLLRWDRYFIVSNFSFKLYTPILALVWNIYMNISALSMLVTLYYMVSYILNIRYKIIKKITL